MELKMIELKKLISFEDSGVRRGRDEKAFGELKESIKAKGLVFPLVAAGSGNSYRLIDGVLRLAAVSELGWDKDKRIPVILIDADDGEAVEAALVANAVRENINSLGLAEAVNLLVNEYKRKAEDIAAALGKTKSYIYRLLRIFNLPENVLSAVRDGDIGTAHCYWLAKLIDDPDALNDVFKKLIAADLSIRDLETLVSGYLSRGKSLKSDYNFFAPKVVITKAGSRLRFEPRRRSVRVECNINLNEPIDIILAEIKRNLKKLARGRLRVVG